MKKVRSPNSYLGLGLALGIVIGVITHHLAIGIVFGVLFGAAARETAARRIDRDR